MAEAVIRITDDAMYPEQLDELAVDLLEAIAEGPVDAVDRRSAAAAPDGARGTDLVEFGVLLVQVALDTGLLTDLAQRVNDWRNRRRVQQVEVVLGESRLVLSDASPEQQQELIAHFIRATSSQTN